MSEAPPRIFRVIVPVRDIELATTFYTGILGLSPRSVSPGRRYFDCGGVILACYDPRADGDDFDASPNPDHIYLAVDDLEATHRRAADAGCAQVDTEISTRPWGERSFYCRDPFGNRLCFVDERTKFTGA